MDKGKLERFCDYMSNENDSVRLKSVLNVARAEFLLINETDPEKLLDAIYTWYIQQFGELGL